MVRTITSNAIEMKRNEKKKLFIKSESRVPFYNSSPHSLITIKYIVRYFICRVAAFYFSTLSRLAVHLIKR